MMMPGRHHPIDALFEDVFGGFPTMHEYGGTQRCGRTMRARSTTAARRLLRDVKVEETSRGYLVTAYVPGVSARDVEEDDEDDRTRRARPVSEGRANARDAREGGRRAGRARS